MIPDHFRSRLNRIPLKTILVICGTVLLIGFDRGGMLATIWLVAWAAFLTAKVAIGVKRKVQLKQIQVKTEAQ